MELNLGGLAIPTQLLIAAVVILLTIVGHRLMRGMDRVADSVEALNLTMVKVVATQEGHGKRLDLLETK